MHIKEYLNTPEVTFYNNAMAVMQYTPFAKNYYVIIPIKFGVQNNNEKKIVRVLFNRNMLMLYIVNFLLADPAVGCGKSLIYRIKNFYQ